MAFRPREVAPTLRPPPGEADEVQAHARAQALPSGTMNPLAMGATAAAGAGSLPDPPAAAVRSRLRPRAPPPRSPPPFRLPSPPDPVLRPRPRGPQHAGDAQEKVPRQARWGTSACPGAPPKRLPSRGLTRRQAHQWQARFFELDVRRRELRYARQAPSAEDEAALHAASAATRIRARARAGGGAPCVALPLSWVSHVDYHPGKRQGRRLAVAVSVPPGVQSVAGARGGPSAGAARVGLLRAIQRRRRPSGDAGDIPVTAAASGPPEDELLSALARSAPTEEARGRAEAAVAARSRQGSRRNTEASLDSVELSAAASAAAGGDDTASVGTHSPAASEASFATGIGGGGPTASQEAAVARLWTGRPDVRLYAASSLDLMAGSKEIAAAWVDALAGVCMGQQLAAEVLQRVVRRHLRATRRRRQSRPRSVLTPLLPVAARPRPQRSSVAAAAGAISGAAAAASAQARAARRASLATLAARGTPRPAAAQSDRGEGAAREGGEHLRSRQPAHVLRFARRASTAAGRIVPGQVEPYSERVASTARIAAARRASAAKTEAPPGTAAPEQLEPNRGALVACHVEQRKRGSEALGAAQLAWLDLRRNDSDTAWFLAPLPFGAGPSGAAEAPRSVQVESGAGRPADVASRLRDDTCAFGALRLVVGGQFQVRGPYPRRRCLAFDADSSPPISPSSSSSRGRPPGCSRSSGAAPVCSPTRFGRAPR